MISSTIDTCKESQDFKGHLKVLVDLDNNAGKSPIEFGRRFKQVHFGKLVDFLLNPF